MLTTLDGKSAIETEEGPIAYVEAIEFLKKQKALRPLVFDKGLEKAGMDHVKDIGSSGQYGGIGSGKSVVTSLTFFRWIITAR